MELFGFEILHNLIHLYIPEIGEHQTHIER